MIPKIYLIEWSKEVPWPTQLQVEQDLIITRALLEIYSDPVLQKSLAFRGGTALNKIILKPALRYSEDIDLVQVSGQPIGPTLSRLQEILNPWLGQPKRDINKHVATLIYKVKSEEGFPIRLKIEINIREHFTVLGFHEYSFISSSTWFPGTAIILSYKPEELMGTKLRALYQRRKGRDLYDLHKVLTVLPKLEHDKIIHCFKEYIKHEGHSISKEDFLSNIAEKLKHKEFREDIRPLLADNAVFDADIASQIVCELLIEKI